MSRIAPNERRALQCFTKLTTGAVFLSFFLISLGSLVRATNSGLSCPDWPLCFNQVVPVFDTQIFLEWFHRVVAGVLTLLVILATWTLGSYPALRRAFGKQLIAGFFLLSIQIVLGGLTVLHLLDPKTVSAHLTNALLFFTVLLWANKRARGMVAHLSVATQGQSFEPLFTSNTVKRLFSATTFLVLLQIAVGGMVSSNYAGLACPDFPTCHGSWVPPLLKPLVLQMVHRAIGISILVSSIAIFFVTRKESLSIRKKGLHLPLMVLAQIIIGVGAIHMKLPVWASVLHLANATAIYTLLVVTTYDLFEGTSLPNEGRVNPRDIKEHLTERQWT